MTSIVVPISAATADEIVTLARQAQAAGADLVEVRLDICAKLTAPLNDIIAVIPQLALPVIATVRHGDEGGDWVGSEADRVALLTQADARNAAYIDIELAHAAGLSATALRAKRILSYHDFDGMGSDLPGRIAAMRAAGADVAKVAVQPSDAADLAVVRELYQTAGGPLVAIAMGEHGLPSRLLAGVWGAAFTFARLANDGGSAPGQPTVDELLRLYRLKSQSPQTKVYGVIGSPVSHSLSPLIHNSAFAHHGLDAVYVPFRVEDAPAFWRACGDWIAGLSVTIPHKQTLLGLMHGIEDLAARIGAMNTVYRDRDLKPIGANTDALAVIRCLEAQLGTLSGRRVLLLGAGGVSRAIAVAVQERGAQVLIANRTLDRARELAEGIGAESVDIEGAYDRPYDVLINGTAAGMGKPDESPWPAERHRRDTVVFDTVYHPLETRLLKDAQLAGARTVCGLDMLISQALGQYQRWTGLEAPEHLMYRAALDRLGATRTG